MYLRVMVFVFLKGVTFRDSLIQGGPKSGRCLKLTRSHVRKTFAQSQKLCTYDL